MIQFILFAVIVFAFILELFRSISGIVDFLVPKENGNAHDALIIIDEPIRLGSVILLGAGFAAGILYVTSRQERFDGHRKLSLALMIVLACLSIGIIAFGRIITDNIMSSESRGQYTFCRAVTTRSSGANAMFSPSFWIYSRIPDACTEMKSIDFSNGYQRSQIRRMNEAVEQINRKYGGV